MSLNCVHVHIIFCDNNVQEPMRKSGFVIIIIPFILAIIVRYFSNLITTIKTQLVED